MKQSTPEEFKERVIREAERGVIQPKDKGGQTVGRVWSDGYRVESKGLRIKVEVNYYRSDFKNRDVAETIFATAIDELLK